MFKDLKVKMKKPFIIRRMDKDSEYLHQVSIHFNCTPLEVACRESVIGKREGRFVTDNMTSSELIDFARLMHEMMNGGK